MLLSARNEAHVQITMELLVTSAISNCWTFLLTDAAVHSSLPQTRRRTLVVTSTVAAPWRVFASNASYPPNSPPVTGRSQVQLRRFEE